MGRHPPEEPLPSPPPPPPPPPHRLSHWPPAPHATPRMRLHMHMRPALAGLPVSTGPPRHKPLGRALGQCPTPAPQQSQRHLDLSGRQGSQGAASGCPQVISCTAAPTIHSGSPQAVGSCCEVGYPCVGSAGLPMCGICHGICHPCWDRSRRFVNMNRRGNMNRRSDVVHENERFLERYFRILRRACFPNAGAS